MNIRETLRAIMNEKGIRNAHVARAIGVSPQSVYIQLNAPDRKTIDCESARKIANALGYNIVLVPIGSKTPVGGYVIGE